MHTYMGKTSTGGQCLVKNLNFASLIVKIGQESKKVRGFLSKFHLFLGMRSLAHISSVNGSKFGSAFVTILAAMVRRLRFSES